MRIEDQIQNIDYNETKEFFNKRAKKYNTVNPYAVTMYQDDNAELVLKRNKYETEKLISLLCLDYKSTVLDIACGIGRWADALNGKIKTYLGIDFSEELIRIAKKEIENKTSTLLWVQLQVLINCYMKTSYLIEYL